MFSELTEVESLFESKNFGQWIEKINEIIDAYNDSIKVTNGVASNVKQALEAGQIGNTLSSDNTQLDYNKFVTNGIYYIKESSSNAPNSVKNNLYVATNGECITQFVVSIEEFPKFYIRVKRDSTIGFSPWYHIPSKKENDNTYFPKNPTENDKIVGDLSVTETTTTKNLSVQGNTQLNGDISILSKDKNYDKTLFITNDDNNTIFNAKINSFPTVYYIQDDNSVTKDEEGKIIEYYLIDDTLITYNNVYYMQTGNMLVLDNKFYYIQDNGNVSSNKNGTDVEFIIRDNNVFKVNKETETESLLYYILNGVWYTYYPHFILKENDNGLYLDKTYQIPTYYIEDNVITEHILYAHIHDNIVTSIDGSTPIYYIKDNIYYTDAEYTSPIFYVIDNKVCSDIEGNNVIYFIKNDSTLIEKRIVYYVDNNVVYKDETYSESLFYITDNKIISILETKYHYRLKGVISTDVDNKKIVYYLPKYNRITSDIEGNVVVYYLQKDNVITTDRLGRNVVYYIENNAIRTRNIKYYIQNNNQVTSDKEGLSRVYIKVGNKLLEDTYPLIIDMENNISNINGTAEFAQFVKPTGLTDSYLGTGLDKAASGRAVFDLYNFNRIYYMPYSGGVFTGLVSHQNDIRLDKIDDDRKQPKIYSYGDLNFECLKTVSFTANNDWCELYIDRINRQSNTDVPCIIGARTRGTTANEIGDPFYALGSIEFTEDMTTIRLRKTNLTNVENNEEKTNIALVLERNSFSPSVDRVLSLGSGKMRFTTVYTTDSAISTSDRNLKTDILDIDDALLDKWKNIKWKTFKYKASVDEKGDNARIHSGLIAQEVEDVVDVLEARKYGFYCEDSWDDVYDTQYLTFPAQYDISGVMTRPERREKVVTLKKAAGSQLSLRYQEVQAIENAYLRRELETLRKEVEELKKLIKN